MAGLDWRASGRPTQYAPCKAAALVEVIGVSWIVGVGCPADLDMAFDLGMAHPVEFEQTALSLSQSDVDAEVPLISGGREVLSALPGRRFGGVSSLGPQPE